MRYFILAICSIAVQVLVVGCVEQERGDSGSIVQYEDLVFDNEIVNIDVNAQTDTVYLGFHRANVDDNQYMPMYVNVERWSTAKMYKDFVVGPRIESQSGGVSNSGFYVECNVDRFKGQFYMIINPEQITEPKFVKFYLYYPGHKYYNFMTVNLNPVE